jgi:hypothetical protein
LRPTTSESCAPTCESCFEYSNNAGAKKQEIQLDRFRHGIAFDRAFAANEVLFLRGSGAFTPGGAAKRFVRVFGAKEPL